MEWTKDQQKVIELRNRNILVSAAAGSGKTAVLVARIISMISEGEHPIDIDRLLIVTFTNAAAAEMRERIGAAIEKKVAEMPENLHLQKQMTLIHSAQITTIHSFCLNVIRNHFNIIDLDPSFRIADDAELVLMKSDVIEELLEAYYEESEEDFLNFVESFSSGKSDAAVEDLILKLYDFSMSYPWPEEWLNEKKKSFSISTLEEMMNSDWMKKLLSQIKTILNDMQLRCKSAIRICEEADGPSAYITALESDADMLSTLTELSDYEEYLEAFTNLSFARLSGKKEEGVSEDKKNQVKLIREEIKKAIGDIKKNYFFQSAEDMFDDIRAMKRPMEVLLNLTIDFAKAYAEKKAEKNLVDFNDLEHFALRILVQKNGDETVPTPAAKELSEYYAEILIDEYQDSNEVQETIMNSISGERDGRPNLFMVGDVKQSIYKFRLARPEIFMEKFENYDTMDSDHQRIDLHKNFRSREVVLDSINFIFEQIMTKKLGNIEYDYQVALYPGADFGEEADGISKYTEILLVSVDPPETDDLYGNNEDAEVFADKEEEEYTAKEIEAKAIAKRIKELTDPEYGLRVIDKKKQSRQAEYRDIVILLRTMSNWADVFADTLAAEGIPVHTETHTGYFSTIEIRTILNLLRIIDNPRHDIPFTAILRSPIVGLDSDDLAMIRIAGKGISMYEAAVEFSKGAVAKNESEILIGKLTKFLTKLEGYRNLVYVLSIHELILKVLEDSGYYYFASAMPAGEKRRANIDMLIQRAVSFESTSYRGLFHFIRYIEKLNKYDVDFGEAEIAGGNDNTVKIMSIHKSKGLEFPIVFAAGMGKVFNNQDSRSKLLIHPDLGLGPDYMDHKLRVKAPTLIKKVIQKEMVFDNLGEELRVLYVALTRAKEKLIITGGLKKAEDKLVKWANICRQEEKQFLFSQLASASSFLDWIIPAVMRHRGFSEILSVFGISSDKNSVIFQDRAEIVVNNLSYLELATEEIKNQISNRRNQEELTHWDNEIVYDSSISDEIRERMEFPYPYQTETNIHTKLTVSELKKLGQLEKEDLGVSLNIFNKRNAEKTLPAFIRHAAEQTTGADLGTVYHRVLEDIRLTEINYQEDLILVLDNMVLSGRINQIERKALDVEKLYTFTLSPVAKRMRTAEKLGKLYTERQFVMGMQANEINSNLKSEEMVLVQGVIDVYFEEENDLIIVDYKTDSVDVEEGEAILVNRYATQLNYYQKALEQLTNKRVKEKIIYSFGLNREILIH